MVTSYFNTKIERLNNHIKTKPTISSGTLGCWRVSAIYLKHPKNQLFTCSGMQREARFSAQTLRLWLQVHRSITGSFSHRSHLVIKPFLTSAAWLSVGLTLYFFFPIFLGTSRVYLSTQLFFYLITIHKLFTIILFLFINYFITIYTIRF